MMRSPIRTVIQDDYNHLFLCLEADALPPVPAGGITFQDPKSSWLPDPKDFIRRSWASDTMPYQGFLPVHRSSVYQCVLFKCLDYSSASIPLFSPSPGQWALETKVADKWKHLEILLDILRRTLGKKLDCVERLSYPRFPPPWEYGYHHAKCHKMAMEHAAMRSRDAFLILAGEISFLLALTLAKKDGDDWEITLTEEVGGNWTDLIRTSWLVQNDSGFWQGEEASRRVGLFVDPRACKNAAKFLEAYTTYSIPVWINWGPITSPFEALDQSLRQKYYFWVPPSKVVRRTKAAEHIAPQTHDISLGTGRRQTGEIFVVSESEQNVRRTTGYSDVLAANHSDNTRVTVEGHRYSEELQLLHTPTYEKQSCHVRTTELVSEEQKYPIGNVDTFVWERVDDKEYVAMRHVSDSSIPPGQRHPPLPMEKGAQASVGKLSALSWEKAYSTKLFEAQSQVLSEDLKPKEHEYWPLKDVLRFRFGIQTARPTDPSPSLRLTAVDEAKVTTCLKSLEYFSVPQDDVEKSVFLSLGEFVLWLAWHATKKEGSGKSVITASHVQPPPTSIPVTWWDLLPQSHSYLGKLASPLDIQAVRWHDGGDERTGYRLQVQGASKVHEQRYMLIVYRADDVLHCLRLSGMTCLDDLIEELCGHGIRFTVGVQADPSNPKSGRKPCVNGPCQTAYTAIPYRPANFKAGLLDYISYVRRRAALLRDPVVAKAALMHGGIIWRLAMEHIDDFSVILQRPTDDILRYGKCHKVTVLGREEREIHMWEESLSESQLNVICGVYKVYNQSPNGYSLTQDISWFPKDGSFKNSALSVGFWTADTEQWYIRRVQLYLSADSEKSCLNQAGWRSSVRLWSILLTITFWCINDEDAPGRRGRRSFLIER
ncbi:uncharacterized protein EV420DRAFT_1473853 [Desarmillaria tabescens]|uniref:Uncharacterized protein n=1 Tax=Armillaria tabescens TaxID=1929756 RepID=A0AA39T6L6_ARMTA|nr:uncharacterized protein EV420DRAFT_1473853 [Desarmillaria tabescens]KAK0468101.1 hypothetical protein EV420DRAFT_1473853 [Desarmillaria tabescens]